MRVGVLDPGSGQWTGPLSGRRPTRGLLAGPARGRL